MTLMSSKRAPTIWSRDTGHICLRGGVGVRTVGRKVTKTKFSRTDGLPYVLTHGAPRARGTPL